MVRQRMFKTWAHTWYIGTSGFSFNDWIGTVYPENIKNNEMFTYYWQKYGFNAVELNFTFYQIPSYRTIISLLRKAPPDFEFALKLHKSITHNMELSNIDNFVKNTIVIHEEGKLIGYLAQFPYSFRFHFENVEFLKKLAHRVSNFDLFVEFRNSSWVNRDEVFGVVEHFPKVHIVIPDLPNIAGLYTFNTDYSKHDKIIYLRLHGRNQNWFVADEKTRYDYDYKEIELESIANSIMALPASTRFVFFNNCYRGQALKNAVLFREYVGGESIGIF